MVIDSRLTPSQALAQNPDGLVCPPDILGDLGLMEVRYLSFDGQLHQGQIVVQRAIMAEVEAFFRMALALQFPIAKVIPPSAPEYRWDKHKLVEQDNITYGFAYRTIAGTKKLSLHAYGRAFDVNPQQNPYIRYQNGKAITWPSTKWDAAKAGTLHAEHPLVRLMEGYGWEWGGHWLKSSGRTDYMHFQKL